MLVLCVVPDVVLLVVYAPVAVAVPVIVDVCSPEVVELVVSVPDTLLDVALPVCVETVPVSGGALGRTGCRAVRFGC